MHCVTGGNFLEIVYYSFVPSKTNRKDAIKAADITPATISFRIRRFLVVNILFSQIISDGWLAALTLIGLTPGKKIGKFWISSLFDSAESWLNLEARLNDSSFSNVTKAEQGLESLLKFVSLKMFIVDSIF